MPIIWTAFFLLAASSANAASVLRITCQGDDVGAEVSVNGVFKGECPLEIKVAPGTLKLSATKKVGAGQRAFETEIRLGDDVVKTVEVALSAPRSSGAEQTLAGIRKAAEAGDAHAMYLLGYHYETGRGIEKSMQEAATWYHKAFVAGSVAGAAALGSIAYYGLLKSKDQALAVELWRGAAAAGNGQAMNGLATAYAEGAGGLPKDEAQALAWLEKAAAANYPSALVALSDRYREGKGVARNPEQHVALLNKAIALGSASATSRLGYAYSQGIGVPKDPARAVELYRRAAEMGDPFGTYAFGVDTFYGRGGVAKDPQRGIELIEKAAALGSTNAKTTLARPEFVSEKARLTLPASTGQARFVISADGQEVTDNKTRLVWRRCAEGMKLAGNVCEGSPRKFTHADAVTYTAGEVSRSGKPWHLPEINDELGTIWDTGFKPPFDPIAFPSTPRGHFWSSTRGNANMGMSGCAWAFDFHETEGYGSAAGCAENTASLFVRLVRAAP